MSADLAKDRNINIKTMTSCSTSNPDLVWIQHPGFIVLCVTVVRQ